MPRGSPATPVQATRLAGSARATYRHPFLDGARLCTQQGKHAPVRRPCAALACCTGTLDIGRRDTACSIAKRACVTLSAYTPPESSHATTALIQA